MPVLYKNELAETAKVRSNPSHSTFYTPFFSLVIILCGCEQRLFLPCAFRKTHPKVRSQLFSFLFFLLNLAKNLEVSQP